MKVTVDNKGILVVLSTNDLKCLEAGSLVAWEARVRVAVTREDLPVQDDQRQEGGTGNTVCPNGVCSLVIPEDEVWTGCDC